MEGERREERRGSERAALHKVRLATPIIRDRQERQRGREREAADWMGWMDARESERGKESLLRTADRDGGKGT